MRAPAQSPNNASPDDTPAPPFQARAALALIDFSAVVAQIVFMRELVLVFVGNEISLGLTLAVWLLWTAIGSGLLGRLGSAGGSPAARSSAAKVFAALLALQAVVFPVTVAIVRLSRAWFHPAPGELLGPGAMLLTAFVTLSLFCAISGWLFAAGARMYARAASTSTAAASSSVYLLEAIGSGIGGLCASVLLIRFLNAFQIASVVVLLNLLGATFAFRPRRARRAAAVAALVIAVAMFSFASQLERASLARLWRGFDLIASHNSVYGNLAVIGGEGSRSVYENGLNLFNVPDPAAAEEAVHYALLEHPAPHSVLLIGGGVNGSALEALRHPTIARVTYVELDRSIFDLAQKYFPQEWHALRSDTRITTHAADGRLFVKTGRDKYDVIIVNLPDPQTAQLNRFYTREFFAEAAARLSPGGVLALQLRSSENYISPELAEFLRCIHRTLREVFPDVTAIPGDTVHFFGANSPGVLVRDSQQLVARLRERNLQTTYVREYYIPFRMMPDRMLELEQQVRPRPETPVNRDFAPIAYYFDVTLWSGQFNRGYRAALRTAFAISFNRVLLVSAGGLIMLLAFVLARREPRARAGAALCVAGMGFTMIALEVLLLLGFQAIYGYVYRQLAIVIGAFMAGMALGSWLALRTRRNSLRAVALLQLAAAASPLLLFAILRALGGVTSPTGLLLTSEILFPLLALSSGLLGGYQFPIATRMFMAERKDASPSALYALDLAGACLAAVLLSAYFVPVFGFLRTAVFIAVADCVLAAAAFWAARSRAGQA